MPGFRTLIRQNRLPLKLCFLVDGLDEFDGNQEEIIVRLSPDHPIRTAYWVREGNAQYAKHEKTRLYLAITPPILNLLKSRKLR